MKDGEVVFVKSESEYERIVRVGPSRFPFPMTRRAASVCAEMGQLSTPFDFKTRTSYQHRVDGEYVHSCGGEIKEA